MSPPELDTIFSDTSSKDQPIASLHALGPINTAVSSSQYITIDDIKNATVGNKRLIIVFKQGVYDVTKWANDHPGGSVILESMNGSDCTDVMSILHPPHVVEKYLSKLYLGKLDEAIRVRVDSADSLSSTSSVSSNSNSNNIHSSKTPVSISFRKLHKRMMRDGLFDVDMGFYYREIAKVILVLTSSLGILIYNPTYLANQVISAVLMAFFWQQLAFIAHDAGHSGITSDATADHYIGVFLGNLLGGLSISWWKHSHYVHHVVTNDPSKDPDIQHLPFIALSSLYTQSAPVWSSYHKRFLLIDFIGKVVIPVQALTYYFVLFLGRINLYALSLHHLFTNISKRRESSDGSFENMNGNMSAVSRKVLSNLAEVACLVVFWIWYSHLMMCMPSAGAIALYVVISHGLTFILHIQINLSHFAMDISDMYVSEDSFIEHQLRTTMDIQCPKWFDWFHGGLQFQVVHHLFPRLPRRNLRKAQQYVIQFCIDNNLIYKTIDFMQGNIIVLNKLLNVSSEYSERILTEKVTNLAKIAARDGN